MPDFSRPEYASYVQLCRELRLERELVEGDVFHDSVLVSRWGGSWRVPPLRTSELLVWLPTLADWLEMLGAAGSTGEAIMRCPNDPHCYRVSLISPYVKEEGHAYTREEAAARLWMAVTGEH